MPDLGRQEAIAVLQRERAATMELVNQLSREQAEQRGLGGGDWSVKELLGHLESWEEHALGAMEAWAHGQVSPIHQALSSIGLDAVNAGELGRKAMRGYDEQLVSALATREKLVATIESTTDSAWNSPPLPDLERTVADLIGSLLSSDAGPFTHDTAHLADLQALVEG